MMVRWLSHEIDMLPKRLDAGQMIFQGRKLMQSDGQMMVKWFFKERDKSHWWSDTGQMLVRCWSDDFPRKEASRICDQILVRCWSYYFPE